MSATPDTDNDDGTDDHTSHGHGAVANGTNSSAAGNKADESAAGKEANESAAGKNYCTIDAIVVC